MSSASNSIVRSTINLDYIYREYIVNGHDFPTEIIPTISQYHFILGFASENYDDSKQGTGHFKPTWNVDYITAEKVKKLKEDHPTVEVVISIGGVGTEYPFNPVEKTLWIESAIDSIKEIILPYGNLVDGIDIHYDEIKTRDVDFSSCIGKVIRKLKNDTDLSINVVSIAPTEQVQNHYLKLYLDNKDVIDWVDYQFYNQTVSSVDEFIKLYKKLVDAYGAYIVLPGVTIPDNPIITEGIRDLLKRNAVRGFFVWKMANDSAIGSDPFFLEKILQNLSNEPS